MRALAKGLEPKGRKTRTSLLPQDRQAKGRASSEAGVEARVSTTGLEARPLVTCPYSEDVVVMMLRPPLTLTCCWARAPEKPTLPDSFDTTARFRQVPPGAKTGAAIRDAPEPACCPDTALGSHCSRCSRPQVRRRRP